jgi:predicted ATPase
LLIKQIEALGEVLEDPLLLFSALYGIWVAKYVDFNGVAVRQLAVQFLALAEKQRATGPLMIGHRLVGMALAHTGALAEALSHYDRAIAFYDPMEHRVLAAHFGQDQRVALLSYRSWLKWLLGYPEAGLTDVEQALKDARESNQIGTLMYALFNTVFALSMCGRYEKALAQLDELASLATEQDAVLWKSVVRIGRGSLFAQMGEAADAVQMTPRGLSAWQATGSTCFLPWLLSHLAKSYGELGQIDEAWHHVREAMTAVAASKETWFEPEAHRIAGEIAVKEWSVLKAEASFNHALSLARGQQAKSWELRAAMSMARLWRDQGKRDEASDLLAPVYGWFTEGFDTLDLKEAKVLLDELSS